MKRLWVLGFLVLLALPAFAGGGAEPAKGEVIYAVPTWALEDHAKLIAAFQAKFPGVTVTMSGYEGGQNDYLTATAAAGKLPDVFWGWESLTYPVSQGWVYPLDDFLKADPDAKYLNKTIMEAYKFLGKTYAVPHGLQFSGVLVNLDLVDQLNLDKPSYTWTVDQFKALARKATTDKYSGINHLWSFDEFMAGVYSSYLIQDAYDMKTGQFNLTDGSWAKAIALQKELKAVPGLVSDDLKNEDLRKEGKADDYQKKFGKDADALREGKVLMGYHGTWDLSWIRTMSYRWDLYPLPQADKGWRQAIHADHAFLGATAKYPVAAYQFMKWLTFSPDGIGAAVELYNTREPPDFVLPGTNHPDIMKLFATQKGVPAGVAYMFQHQDKTFKGDPYKTVPGWDDAFWNVIFPANEDIRKGLKEAPAIAKEIQDKANEVLRQKRAEFEAALKKAQDSFPQLRKTIEAGLK